MSKIKYRISKQAINDLNDIWIYTFHKWSKEQADNYLTGKSAEQTRKDYRVTKIKSHLIFYKKVENDIVEIVRILHQRMDIKKGLN